MSTKFVFLVLPEIHNLDLAGPDQAIHEAIDYGADFEIEYCSNDEPIISTSGLPLGALQHYSKVELKKGDFIIVPGSNFTYFTSTAFLAQRDLFNWVKSSYQKGVSICSICIGAFVLAESGLLNELQCTTHFKKTRELQDLYPKSKVLENILYTDQNEIYTSAGIVSGIDLTLHIIEKLKGSYFANKVARELVMYQRRTVNSAQESDFLKFRNHIHSGIHNVQDFIFENLNVKSKLYDLANIAHMSERNFTRIFKKETGITVNEFITMIRRERIIQLMKNPDLSKIEIANSVGLESEKQVLRILKT